MVDLDAEEDQGATTVTDLPDVDLAAEVTEFTSLLRARLIGAFDEASQPGQSSPETLWNRVHGVDTIQADSMQELADKVSDMLVVKRGVGVLVAALLAVELAKQTGRSALDHITDVERTLVEGAPS
ncbi:hypothetical protein ACVCAH_11595 [Micromonospora sp. LZ34]